MHFVQTRIATIDVYGVFFIMLMFYFMYRYYTLNFYMDGFKATLKPLAWCGVIFGLGVASKWISLYAGAGLAVILFITLYERYREYARERKQLAANLNKELGMNSPESLQITTKFPRYTIWTLAWCLLWFVFIPFVIYIASYIPFMMVDGPGHGLRDVFTYQKNMYNYHSQLVAVHPFASTWIEWPLMIQPMWYYGGQDLLAGQTSRIIAFGNPAVWWLGIISMIAAMLIGMWKRDRRMIFLMIVLGSVYLPWVLVTRLTFIYHFFAVVPFMILCTTYLISYLKEQSAYKYKRWVHVGMYTYLTIVVVLFAMFYPVLSGAVVDHEYTRTFLKWFGQWPI
jgi:dolichyl-phosphate-mannose--protein O-mannosyl transferase